MIEKGQEWYDKKDPTFIVRVMAVADGWLMLRRPGCMPFVKDAKTFEQQFVQRHGAPKNDNAE